MTICQGGRAVFTKINPKIDFHINDIYQSARFASLHFSNILLCKLYYTALCQSL